MSQQSQWTDRIVDRGEADPATLIANPGNFREHPAYQQRQLERVLDQVGWVEDVIVNRTTGHVVDGHLRVGLALSRNETVPVAYVELSEADEKVALATLDTITTMAVRDDAALVGLLDDVGGDSAGLVDWMRNEGRPVRQPTQGQIDEATDALQGRFQRDPDAQGVELECPQCGGTFGIAGIGVTS